MPTLFSCMGIRLPSLFNVLHQRRYFLLFLLIICCGDARAQKAHLTDSAETQKMLSQSVRAAAAVRYDSAEWFAKKALEYSRMHKYRLGEARSYDQLAEVMLLNGKMNDMSHYDSLVLPIARQLKDFPLLMSAYNRQGVYFMERGKTKESESSFLQALDLGLEKQQSSKTAEVYSNLGSTYLAIGDRNKSIDWFFKALRLFEKKGNETGMGETFSNISSIYYLQGNINDAISYQQKSIQLREKNNDIPGLVITNVNIGQLFILRDSFPLAKQHLEKAVKYAEISKSPKLLGSAYTGMLVYYNRKKEFPAALEWQLKAVRIFEETDNKPMLSRLYVASGNLAHVINDSVKAVEYYSKGLALAKLLKNKENIANAYEKLSIFYQSRNNSAEALQYYKQFILYKDSVGSSSTTSQIEEIRTKYETEKKDVEIQRLSTEQKIKALQIEKQNAIITGNLAEAQRKQNEIDLLSQTQALQELKLQRQEQELEKQSLVSKNNEQRLLLGEQERKLKDKQLASQRMQRNLLIGGAFLLGLFGLILFNRYKLKKKLEQQGQLLKIRSDIARDLHDEIGSTLTSIKILSEVSNSNIEKDKQKAAAFMSKITEQSAQMQQGMSDIVWAIKPDNDKLENMLVRMREFTHHTLEPKGIMTYFNVEERALDHSLDMEQRRDYFLVFKEAINNIAKYANASRVDIQLSVQKQQLVLEIRDNGNGFTLEEERSSNGLKNMQSRAIALGGHCLIDSAKGKGTIIRMEIPAT